MQGLHGGYEGAGEHKLLQQRRIVLKERSNGNELHCDEAGARDAKPRAQTTEQKPPQWGVDALQRDVRRAIGERDARSSRRPRRLALYECFEKPLAEVLVACTAHA
jgi:hypothetical protein